MVGKEGVAEAFLGACRYHHHLHHHHRDDHHIIIILIIIPITINIIVFPMIVGAASSLAFNRFLPAYRYSSSFPLFPGSILHLTLKTKDLEIQEKGDGNTGLMLASREGHLPIISLLLLTTFQLCSFTF